MNEGYVEVSNQLLEREWYKDKYAYHVFIHLILTADEKGQCVTNKKCLANKSGVPSEKEVEKGLKTLQKADEIKIEPFSNKYFTITVMNFNNGVISWDD